MGVRSVKTCLRKVIGKAPLSYEELETILTEVEAVVITFTNTSSEDPVPLFPAHLLIGQCLTTLPPTVNVTSAVPTANQSQLSRRWKYRQRLMNMYAYASEVLLWERKRRGLNKCYWHKNKGCPCVFDLESESCHESLTSSSSRVCSLKKCDLSAT